jgi:hypothetical protein
MKNCHVCGQKLPLKPGQLVEFNDSGRYAEQGIVVRLFMGLGQTPYAEVMGLVDGCGHNFPVSSLTRLHGYYRITEREAL